LKNVLDSNEFLFAHHLFWHFPLRGVWLFFQRRKQICKGGLL